MNQLPLEVRVKLAVRDFEGYEEQFTETYMRFDSRKPEEIRIPERRVYVDAVLNEFLRQAEFVVTDLKIVLCEKCDFDEDGLAVFNAKLYLLYVMLTNANKYMDENGY